LSVSQGLSRVAASTDRIASAVTFKRTLTAEEAEQLLATRPIKMTGLTGAAGEYFVAAELSLRAWLATVTIKNAPGTDILAQKLGTGTTIAIQTKTANEGNNFQLSAKCEIPSSALNQWFVFVKLHGIGTRPSFFIVPRNVVAGAVYAQHKEHLSRPGKSGKPHKDSTLRIIRARYIMGYEDRWDLLEAPTTDAPLLIDPYYSAFVETFGLPENHPGWG
jgi:hypothetical protein